MKIYLIPGLGYDHRIFEKLDFENNSLGYLKWIEPKPNEDINAYAKRMFYKVLDETDEVVLIGHSLGGIMAQEIASIKKVKKVILISSIKSREELPWYFKLVAPLYIHKLFTKELCINSIKYWGKAHGFEHESDQVLFKSMLALQTNNYLQWALKTLSLWKTPNLIPRTPIVQIHGTNDKTLPIRIVNKPEVIVENGSHIMLIKRPLEINRSIQKALRK